MKQAIHLARPFAFAAAALAFATFCRAATCAETTGGGPLTAATVIARNKAADAAAKPHAEIETWSFTAEGFNGTEQRIVRGDDVLDRETFGPFTTESGKLGGHAWHQNENGYTVSDDGDPPTPAPRHMSLEHVTQPRDLYVVTAVYGGGLTERKSYDAHDFSLVSWDEDAGSDSSHIEYSDFRPGNAGRRKAWLVRASDTRGNRYEARLTSDDLAPTIDDATLAIPPDRRTLVEFPDGVDEVHIPAEVADGQILVHATISGKDVLFVLDSGASEIAIDPEAARELHLTTYGGASITVAGTFKSSLAIAPEIDVGRLTLHNVVMHTAPIDFSDPDGNRVVGLLGFDFIAGAALRVVWGSPLFADGTLDAIRPSVFTPPPLATSMLPIHLGQQVPVLDVGVGSVTDDNFIVDTGAEAPAIIFQHFVNQHPSVASGSGVDIGYDPDQWAVLGVGGRVKIFPLRLSSFRFANLDFRNFLVMQTTGNESFAISQDDGLLGALFLRYFTLYLDYPHQRLYFEPNDNYRTATGAGS